jgi:hypothetical protein
MPPKKQKRNSPKLEDDDDVEPSKKVKKMEGDVDDEHSETETDFEPSERIPSIEFIDFIQDLETHGKDKLSKLKGKFDVAKISDAMPMLQKHHDLFSQPTFNSDFNALYVTAARRKNVAMDTVVNVIHKYLNDGSSVEDFPGFPKAPTRPINSFISTHRDTKHPTLDDIVQLRKKFASGQIDTKPFVDKYAEDCKSYIKKLKKYLDEHSEKIRQTHVSYINNLITRTEKSMNSKAPAAKKPKKEKKTAFDWYKDAHPDMYQDYDEEKRDRKLLKKFNNLDEEQRAIYENIASKN